MNKWIESDTRPHKASLFDTLAIVIKDFASKDVIGKKYLKFLAKLLLQYPKGYKIIDAMLDEEVCNTFITQINILLTKFEYKNLNRSNYLEVVQCEETLNILAILISRSSRMKAEFVRNGTFQLFLDRLRQILRYFEPEVEFLKTKSKVTTSKNVSLAGS